MRTIFFKDGSKLEISQASANTIRDKVIAGCANFQCFSDSESGNLMFMINLNEITCIN